jgi:argininosuccinate lyase
MRGDLMQAWNHGVTEMSDLLWQKPGVKVDERIQRFLAGRDIVHDRELFVFDIDASRAHAEGLANIGILDRDELAALQRELTALADDWQAGRFELDSRFEDCHSAIEARLIERLGDTGRKIHTGRSRNDQVLVASRLYLRAALGQLHAHCRSIAAAALARAASDAHARLYPSAARDGQFRRHVVGRLGRGFHR